MISFFAKKNKTFGIVNYKVPASTLVEVIIAMTILLTIAGITLTIFLNVLKANNSQLQLKAYNLSKAIIADQLSDTKYFQTENPAIIYNFEQEDVDGYQILDITIKKDNDMPLFSKIIYLPPR